MSRILITGTSGFIGRQLASTLAQTHEVAAISRKPTPVAGVWSIQGDFAHADDLRRLNRFGADVVIHLAAVTGGCSEQDGIRVNVGGTHGLLRYWLDRGCRKFVLASSIAAVGMQSEKFRPLQVPIPDEHPCLDRDGYGLSKYLMEEVGRYLTRQVDDLDIIAIRLASIIPDNAKPVPRKPGPVGQWAMGSVTLMYLSDAVACFQAAAEAPRKSGIRIMNAAASQACVDSTVPDTLRAWYGADADAIDFSHYEPPGHERDSVYDIRRIAQEIGFVPQRSVLAS
ncbi:NAD(P)-dependent oxidoreductase [Candidatus Poribacteria bacterium]|nr:NAD(P)-dependent oxidoreductase [Candidatus Poribacteria bacterium]